MSSRGINRQQPSIPEPARLYPEHAALGLAVVAITTIAVALLVEEYTNVVVLRGGYSFLAGLFVAGIVGWIVGTAERRVRRHFSRTVAELTTALNDLRDQVQRQRVVYLPAPGRQVGNMYASASAGDSTAIQPRVAVNPEELREQVEQVVSEELGTREAARSQGYAEGYVDGVSRRGQAEPPPD